MSTAIQNGDIVQFIGATTPTTKNLVTGNLYSVVRLSRDGHVIYVKNEQGKITGHNPRVFQKVLRKFGGSNMSDAERLEAIKEWVKKMEGKRDHTNAVYPEYDMKFLIGLYETRCKELKLAQSCWDETTSDLQKAIRYLREGKAKFSPSTTNSLVDDLLEKYRDL